MHREGIDVGYVKLVLKMILYSRVIHLDTLIINENMFQHVSASTG